MTFLHFQFADFLFCLLFFDFHLACFCYLCFCGSSLTHLYYSASRFCILRLVHVDDYDLMTHEMVSGTPA
ncbi:hypothetical protein K469DRAFT_131191 [Zopfia rhizophila CBS 207.26]|uniref:Uncharacterized protein n=1 Tax=Zopfia rhizophila CBS 207.26 TaxID=1314779 RepID=A0A6A6ER41_9PEZI|nr:hypothetical protein K469DRAFT_131191 [Zopfia rhizophila CBS 207.26]